MVDATGTPEEKITQVITSQQVIDIFAQLSAMNVKLDDIKELSKVVDDNRKTTDRALKDHDKRIVALESSLAQAKQDSKVKWGIVEWLWNNSFSLFLAIVAAGVYFKQ